MVERVAACCTPGETVACVVTQAGVALNPRHQRYEELRADLKRAGMKLTTIQALQELAESITGKPRAVPWRETVAAVVEYRDGSVVDVLREIQGR